MKIKEVEEILDIPKATIRFYEKEGLLFPKRNTNGYRVYSDKDIELLKKVVILRKVGISVDDIKSILKGSLALQDALSKNVSALHEQIKEIEGAIKVCTLMQDNEESIASLDYDYYLSVIHKEEEKGSKFFGIMNDVIDFEKKVIGNEFGLIDENGKLKFTFWTSIIMVIGMCLITGLVWFFLDGMKVKGFVTGILFPFFCIIASSLFGLPLHFLKKRNEKDANIIKAVGLWLGFVFMIIMALVMIFYK